MASKSTLFILLALLFLINFQRNCGMKNIQQVKMMKKLMKSLLTNYTKEINSDFTLGKSTTVYYRAYIGRFTYLENKNTLEVQLTWQFRWNDKRLSWDPKHYSDIANIEIFGNNVWKPDIHVYHSQVEQKTLHKTSIITVNFTGGHELVGKENAKIQCYREPGELSFFPGVSLYCPVVAGTWSYSEYAHRPNIKCINDSDCVRLSNDSTLPLDGWQLYTKDVLGHHYGSAFSVNLYIKQTDLSHYYTYIAPGVFLGFCLTVQFLLPCANRGRILTNTILLLCLVIFFRRVMLEPVVAAGGGQNIVHFYFALIIMNLIAFAWAVIASNLWLTGPPQYVVVAIEKAMPLLDKGAQFLCIPIQIVHSKMENAPDVKKFNSWGKFSLFVDRIFFALYLIVHVALTAALNRVK